LHGDVHFAAHADDDDVAGIDGERRRCREQPRGKQRQRAQQTNYLACLNGIMVMAGHGLKSPWFLFAKCY
jgi:hypothetical protein